MATSDATEPEVELPEPAAAESEPPRQKAVTIGSVCKQLVQEFPDISISKIRYLEDQKLLAPRRTQGGYRLYTQNDIQRLRTILRLQRDEFLPLRVIRQELAGGRSEREVAPPGDPRAMRRAMVSTRDAGALYSLDDVVEETGADPKLVRELEEFGVIKGDVRAGVSDAACSSARHGLVLGSPLLVSGRLYDAERTQPIHHQLDSNCGKKDPEHDLGDDQADGVQALGQLVDVGKDQVIDRADQQDESQDQGGARERDDLAGRNDEDRDADRV